MSKIKVLPAVYFLLAVGFLIVPVRWWLAWIAAAFVHELSHILVLKLCGCKVISVTVGASGAIIQSDCDTWPKKLLCTVAGPLGGSLLLLLSGMLPRVAVCAMLQSVYNLLPLSCLDGGRALEVIISIWLPRKTAERVLHILQMGLIFVMFGLAVYALVYLHVGWMPLVLTSVLLAKNKKSLANKGVTEYNNKDIYTRGLRYDRTNQTDFTYGSKTGKIYRRGV